LRGGGSALPKKTVDEEIDVGGPLVEVFAASRCW
jgi:hypothetical protein